MSFLLFLLHMNQGLIAKFGASCSTPFPFNLPHYWNKLHRLPCYQEEAAEDTRGMWRMEWRSVDIIFPEIFLDIRPHRYLFSRALLSTQCSPRNRTERAGKGYAQRVLLAFQVHYHCSVFLGFKRQAPPIRWYFRVVVGKASHLLASYICHGLQMWYIYTRTPNCRGPLHSEIMAPHSFNGAYCKIYKKGE